ncbi:MAG: alpha/beta fold hydrolase [Alphaproteobacteria bacterium]|nr:alpha/beta fold hydrolase [Alphaproteobacteria bacterium]
MSKKLSKIFNSVTELQRATLEMSILKTGWSRLKDKLPEGDGHPVLVLPGFMTGDPYTDDLRKCISDKGYKSYGWDGGVNLGFDRKTADHLRDRLKEIFEENGGQKISLIGHSLGGIYARELAREFPEMVRDVITMGTPFGSLHALGDATSRELEQIYAMFTPKNVFEGDEELQERGLTPPPVPTTSIYSRNDGIADWEASLNPKTPLTENIEVSGSHLGMAFSEQTVCAILDRLAQPEGQWKPFAPDASWGVSYPAPQKLDLPENPQWSLKTGKGKPMFTPKKPGGGKPGQDRKGPEPGRPPAP